MPSCRRGHDLSEQTPPYLDRDGRQRCRECQRGYKAAYVARQAEEKRQLDQALADYFEMTMALIRAFAADEGRFIPTDAELALIERTKGAAA